MSTNETPVTWRKSSFSQNGNCIELASDKKSIFVRDSKDHSGNILGFRPTDWSIFIARIKSAEHSSPLMSEALIIAE
jgi:hypothetical protein